MPFAKKKCLGFLFRQCLKSHWTDSAVLYFLSFCEQHIMFAWLPLASYFSRFLSLSGGRKKAFFCFHYIYVTWFNAVENIGFSDGTGKAGQFYMSANEAFIRSSG